jgi:hypothetical protein
MEDLFNFLKNLNTAPDLPTREEEHLNHEPLNNNQGLSSFSFLFKFLRLFL